MGYGDVMPTNDWERALTTALALAGAALFGLLVSAIRGLAARRSSAEAAARAAVARVADLCALRGGALAAPRELRARARQVAAHAAARGPHLLVPGAAAHHLLPRAARNEVDPA